MVLRVDKEIQQAGKQRHYHENNADFNEYRYILIIYDFVHHYAEQNRHGNSQYHVKKPAEVKHHEIMFIFRHIF